MRGKLLIESMTRNFTDEEAEAPGTVPESAPLQRVFSFFSGVLSFYLPVCSQEPGLKSSVMENRIPPQPPVKLARLLTELKQRLF